jgi:predicted transcriptional regulator
MTTFEALVDTKHMSSDESRLNFIRAAEESLADYEATGLCITHVELKTWLSTWGSPNTMPIPECHIDSEFR